MDALRKVSWALLWVSLGYPRVYQAAKELRATSSPPWVSAHMQQIRAWRKQPLAAESSPTFAGVRVLTGFGGASRVQVFEVGLWKSRTLGKS